MYCNRICWQYAASNIRPCHRFYFERLRGYCLDHGYTADEFDAVIAVKPSEPLDFIQRLKAVKAFRQLPEAEGLAAANKRIRNILKKSDTEPASQRRALLEAQEKQLLQAALQSPRYSAVIGAAANYQATLNRLAGLRNDVDAFFDHVMVMTMISNYAPIAWPCLICYPNSF